MRKSGMQPRINENAVLYLYYQYCNSISPFKKNIYINVLALVRSFYW